ncbi:MAG: hypothetical protein MR652_15400 [Blautia sp.]|uniref:hypothetical protein n=1 Tax=Lachnospiraceae TaxID=186803 RepID=UPI0024307EE1|nr:MULTISPECIES: hypothetical protein [Lachnospiraceae]MCI6304501.1 hypothetical protein [Blautia sp.]MDD6414136.1 hypothetical protein [Blautia sp.]MDD6588234.1 hypothetical protein [Anaerobutyricum hallii]
MSEVNYEEIKKMTEEQEKELRFDHFSNKDALDLGRFITDKIYAENMQKTCRKHAACSSNQKIERYDYISASDRWYKSY